MKILIYVLIIISSIAISLSTVYAEINEKYSFQAYPYHGLSFKHLDASEFSNSEIKGSMFYQEAPQKAAVAVIETDPRADIFPDGTDNVTFINCNLDNIILPKNSTLINCSNRRIRSFKDVAGEKSEDDRVLDEDNKPIRKVNDE